jgi:hypothetical protein
LSSFLFLVEVIAFVLLAHWAYRNDAIGMDESGSGLFAMRGAGSNKRLQKPRWKRQAPESGARPCAPIKPAPRWRTALRRRDDASR